MNSLLVVAKAGAQCPRENRTEPHITDSVPVTVPDTVFYRRLIDDGSLRVCPAEESTTDVSKKKNGGVR